jgi:hypothetical protein
LLDFEADVVGDLQRAVALRDVRQCQYAAHRVVSPVMRSA